MPRTPSPSPKKNLPLLDTAVPTPALADTERPGHLRTISTASTASTNSTGPGAEYVSFQDNTPPPRTPVAKRRRSILFAMTSGNDRNATLENVEAAAALGNDVDTEDSKMTKNRRKWRLGLIFLLIVVFLWVLSSFMVNSIFETDIYRKPYLVTYLCTASFSLYLIRPLMDGSITLRRKGFKSLNTYDRDNSPESVSLASDAEDSRSSAEVADRVSADLDTAASNGLTIHETSMLSLQFCVLWFAANWLANACLSYTSVASGTILACTSSFFTLLIGSLFGVEKFTHRKLFAIAASLVGIILISTQDSADDDENNNLTAGSIVVGDLMSLGSAAIYGLYTSLLKLRIGDESRINMQIFFGFVGIWNTIMLWPVLVVLHLTGAERLEMPPTPYVWLILFLNCLATLGSDYLWIVTILLTSPLVVTMGLSGTIPLAVIGDIIFNHVHVSLWYLVGAILVGSAFFVINRDEEREHHVIPDDAGAEDAQEITVS
ncbi:hypothetical protein POJ06DRAFT_247225 [Lipomyces tetrasporus]|uniref:EamA domain-containing protein n=1 Tax=Lipomyces tetrasporus TaxID=54092 RepID=A0AAD7VVA7_9ASCO|nr:uncharacterized protein POJ06DRAFT_247225 [Lipomyces tetrasporus]KAJ8103313.1 hypothetical protein POJ06DRAFT_247225 [Lipomyces tetrasporus]